MIHNITKFVAMAHQSRLGVCGDNKLLVIGVVFVQKIC